LKATLLLSIMGSFGEFEMALIRERQMEGIAAARKRGVYTGRKKASPTPRSPRSGSGWLLAKPRPR
jgi:DNA invertase Pin-like site-specific DNA recombinase